MLTSYRPSAATATSFDPPPRQSAVLFLIFPYREMWHTVFIVRPKYNGAHSAQISFPGGKKEPNDANLLQTALRESHEEIGILPHQTEIIGHLSALYIPPSHFIVQPYVGLLTTEPTFTTNREVAELLIEPLAHFFTEPIVQRKKIFIPVYETNAIMPYFDVQGHILWGATAMIVQEMRYMAGFTK